MPYKDDRQAVAALQPAMLAATDPEPALRAAAARAACASPGHTLPDTPFVLTLRGSDHKSA